MLRSIALAATLALAAPAFAQPASAPAGPAKTPDSSDEAAVEEGENAGAKPQGGASEAPASPNTGKPAGNEAPPTPK